MEWFPHRGTDCRAGCFKPGMTRLRGLKGDFRRATLVVSFFAVLAAGSGCYLIRPSNGAGETKFSGTRKIDADSIAVDRGFRIEPVATGLTFPTGVTFDDRNNPCVVESGYAYGEKWTKPRLLRIEGNGQMTEIAGGGRNGPWTGVSF